MLEAMVNGTRVREFHFGSFVVEILHLVLGDSDTDPGFWDLVSQIEASPSLLLEVETQHFINLHPDTRIQLLALQN